MSKSMSQQEVRKYLAAFADGELDVDQNLRVLEQIKMDPNATARITHQQQLREATQRALIQATPKTPDALRNQITKLATAETVFPTTVSPIVTDAFSSSTDNKAAHDSESTIGRVGFAKWRNILQIAAICTLAATLFFSVNGQLPFQFSSHHPQLISTQQLNKFVNRHTACSNEISKLKAWANAPTDVAMLPNFLSKQFDGQAYRSLDLSAMGYTFQRMGACNIPSDKAAHLIYKPIPQASASANPISLWITEYNAQMGLHAGRLYSVISEEPASSVLFWRHNNLVYYLVGNEGAPTQKAYQTLALLN